MEQTEIKLSDVSPEEIGQMNIEHLQQLCKNERLDDSGTQQELQERLCTKKTDSEEKGLSDVSLEEIGQMKINELRKLCKTENLPSGGLKKELQDRLAVKKTGRSDRYLGQDTRCIVCREKVKVIGTTRSNMDDGRVLVIRNIRCIGKNKHTYPLKEIIDPEKNKN